MFMNVTLKECHIYFLLLDVLCNNMSRPIYNYKTVYSQMLPQTIMPLKLSETFQDRLYMLQAFTSVHSNPMSVGAMGD